MWSLAHILCFTTLSGTQRVDLPSSYLFRKALDWLKAAWSKMDSTESTSVTHVLSSFINQYTI